MDPSTSGPSYEHKYGSPSIHDYMNRRTDARTVHTTPQPYPVQTHAVTEDRKPVELQPPFHCKHCTTEMFPQWCTGKNNPGNQGRPYATCPHGCERSFMWLDKEQTEAPSRRFKNQGQNTAEIVAKLTIILQNTVVMLQKADEILERLEAYNSSHAQNYVDNQ